MTTNRIAWPDYAKGLAILLVVFHHSVQYAAQNDISPDWWTWLTEMLRTMRMPLFFMAAGLFAGSWAGKPWRDTLSRKVLFLGWVYLLWIFVRAGWFTVVPGGGIRESPGIVNLVERIIWPMPGWFLFTLAAFFVLMRLTRSIHWKIQLSVAVVASIAWLPGIVEVGNVGWDGIPMFYAFFLIGVFGRNWLMAKRATVPVWTRLSVVSAWVVAYAALESLDLVDAPVLSFFLRLAGLAAGISIAWSVTRAAWLQSVGQTTLPIYVAHLLVVIPVIALLADVAFVQQSTWLQAVLPIAVASFAVLITFWFGVLAPKIKLGWLFAAPKFLESGAAKALTR